VLWGHATQRTETVCTTAHMKPAGDKDMSTSFRGERRPSAANSSRGIERSEMLGAGAIRLGEPKPECGSRRLGCWTWSTSIRLPEPDGAS
jgi:hypothetical protein